MTNLSANQNRNLISQGPTIFKLIFCVPNVNTQTDARCDSLGMESSTKTIEKCGSSDDCESALNRFAYTSSRGNKREITARNLWLLPFVRRQWTSCRSIVSQHICSDVCTELNGAVADANPDFTLRRRGCYRDVISSVVAPSRAKYGNALTDGDNRPSVRPARWNPISNTDTDGRRFTTPNDQGPPAVQQCSVAIRLN